MNTPKQTIRDALRELPRWHVVHWGSTESSTLLCLWVAGRETIVPVDGNLATYDRTRHAIGDGGLVALLRSVQTEQDQQALSAAETAATRQRLIETWSVDGISAGEWEFPRGGFVRWLNNGALHIEASDGGPSDRPLAVGLQRVLVDLGWNAPNLVHRNCWIQPDRSDIDAAARLAVLTPLAAFGCSTPPPLS